MASFTCESVDDGCSTQYELPGHHNAGDDEKIEKDLKAKYHIIRYDTFSHTV